MTTDSAMTKAQLQSSTEGVWAQTQLAQPAGPGAWQRAAQRRKEKIPPRQGLQGPFGHRCA